MPRSVCVSFITAASLIVHGASGQPTGCVAEIGYLGVNNALIQGEAPVIHNGFMYHVIWTNPSATDYELIVVDVSNPVSPNQVGSVNVPNVFACGMPAAIGLQGTELYVLTGAGLSLYDISTPAAPVRVRTLPTVALPCGGVNPGLAVHGQSVVVLSGQVYVVDRALMRIPPPPPPALPNNPIVKVLSEMTGVPQDVAIIGDTAVVSSTTGLHAIDISLPPSSFIRESVHVPGYPGTLAVDEIGRLFVACTFTDHLIESVHPFTTPVPLTGIGTYSVLGTAASGSLYVTGSATSGALVHQIDLLSSPVRVGTSAPFLCESVTFVGSTLIAVSRDEGIRFMDVSACASGTCLADYNADTLPDILDFLDFFDDFGQCDQLPAPCGTLGNPDLNGDTIIDILDFLDFLDAFGQGC